MSKDVAPNVATVVMGLKDKLSGGNEYTPIFNNPEWAKPQTIEAFFHNRINQLKENVESSKRNGNNDTFDAEWQIHQCQKGRNVANAIRLNGPTAFIRQAERWYTAHVAAEIIEGKAQDKNGNYDHVKAERLDRTTRYLAAALGHKQSVKELKRLENK